jgi:hypothetical protein
MSDIKLNLNTEYQLDFDDIATEFNYTTGYNVAALEDEEDPGYVDKAEYGYNLHPNDMVLHQFWGEDKGALVTVNTGGYSVHFTGPDFYAERHFPGYSEHYVESAAENWTLGVLKEEHFDKYEIRVPMPTYATSAIWEEDAV